MSKCYLILWDKLNPEIIVVLLSPDFDLTPPKSPSTLLPSCLILLNYWTSHLQKQAFFPTQWSPWNSSSSFLYIPLLYTQLYKQLQIHYNCYSFALLSLMNKAGWLVGCLGEKVLPPRDFMLWGEKDEGRSHSIQRKPLIVRPGNTCHRVTNDKIWTKDLSLQQ